MPQVMCDSPPPPKSLFGERHKQMLLTGVGLMLNFLQKNMISIGVVAMADTNNNALYPVFEYTIAQKGVLISAFFYGYMAGCLPMGLLISKFGPASVMAVSTGIIGIVSACLPLVAIYMGYEAMCVARALQGIIFGGIAPCKNAMVSRWVAPHEREKFAWINLGLYSSSIVNSLLGLLAASPAGWPSIYYVTGFSGIIWGLILLKYGVDDPKKHHSIPVDEKRFLDYYFEGCQPQDRKIRDLPWLSILTSVPVWVSIFTRGAERWCSNAVDYFFPSFLRGAYEVNIESNGLLTSLPAVASILFTLLFSFLGGLLRSRVSLNFSRKFWTGVACYGSCCVLAVLGTVDTGSAGAVTLMTLFSGIYSANTVGVFMSSMDLSPNWAGALTGFTCIPANLAATLSTTFTGYAITDEHSISDWERVFLVMAAISFIGGTVFILFGSTSIQPWNSPERTSKSEDGKTANELIDDPYTIWPIT